ncbi:hypothetical protein GETHLI_21340 [Geothrix limicola]|uniref:Uncharacterized protein n=1 Tax=Geothrix limicola TaxID=2927978 RepID=A0ABQ5QG45_9BACT|nr:hypothetical protein [Geothrix limicola]GLH73632.1 hypothetical protein GETHLI_21340 [Geothrix limicola]
MSCRAGALVTWTVVLAAALGAQEAKSAVKVKPKPSEVLWRYESPRGFTLPEPAYGFPTPIKQALVQFVQPDPDLTKAYADVLRDKRTFARWLRGVLEARKKALQEAETAGPRVLSSDPSKAAPGKGTILGTTTIRPRAEREGGEIDRYLAVLKVWSSE